MLLGSVFVRRYPGFKYNLNQIINLFKGIVMPHPTSLTIILTYSLRLMLWIMIFEMIHGENRNSLPDSTLESTYKKIPDCYTTPDNAFFYFSCMHNLLKDLPYTFAANMFRDHHTRAFPDLQAQEKFADISNSASLFYRRRTLSSERNELVLLKQEILRLEKASEYERLYQLILAYRHPEMESLSTLIHQAAEKIILEYKRQLCHEHTNEQKKFYLLMAIARVYIVEDNFHEVLHTLNEAIDYALEFSDIDSRSPSGNSIARFQKVAIEGLLENSTDASTFNPR